MKGSSSLWKWLIGVVLIVSLRPRVKEGFEDKSVDLVISHYNEDLDWLADLPHHNFKQIIVYTKGTRRPNCSRFWCQVIPLENVGREGHTYLHHIIQNYNTVADVTIFVPGSCFMDHKKKKTELVISGALADRDTVLLSEEKVENLANDFKDFEIKEWASSHPENRAKNPSAVLGASRIRPFGKWYTHFFGDLVVRDVSYSGILAVSREAVHNRPVAFYESLEQEMRAHANPEAGHYLERSWAAVFHPVPENRFV